MAELAKRRTPLEEKIASLRKEIRELKEQQKRTIQWERLAQNIGEFLQLLVDNLCELSFEQKQAIVQLLVEKVVVTGEEVDLYHQGIGFLTPP